MGRKLKGKKPTLGESRSAIVFGVGMLIAFAGMAYACFISIPRHRVWWIHFYDASGKRRREKAGTKSAAIALYRKRKQEALEGRKLPEKLRRVAVSFHEIAQHSLAYADRHKRSAE